MRDLILCILFRNDSYFKGNRASQVCTFWTSATGESVLTRLLKPTFSFVMSVIRVFLFANQSSALQRYLVVETLPLSG